MWISDLVFRFNFWLRFDWLLHDSHKCNMSLNWMALIRGEIERERATDLSIEHSQLVVVVVVVRRRRV